MDKIIKHKRKLTVLLILAVTIVISAPFLLSNMSISKVQADTVSEAITAAETALVSYNNIPLTSEALNSSQKREYDISSYDDFLALMVLSSRDDLEGYTFYIDKMAGSEGKYDLRGKGFVGISPVEGHMFKGKLISKYAGSDIQITTSVPLFGYLSSTAQIGEYNTSSGGNQSQLNIVVDNASAGIAQTLIGTGIIDKNTFQNVRVSGSVAGEEYAGGIFGQVINADESVALEIKDTLFAEYGIYNTITSISGAYAGGFAGNIEGNVIVNIENSQFFSDASITGNGASGAAGGIAGQIIGTVSAKPVVNIGDFIDVENNITSNGMAGGIAGNLQNATINASENVGINMVNSTDKSAAAKYLGSINGITYAGGIAGYMENVEFYSKAFSLNVNVQRGQYVGGFCGYAKNLSVNNAGDINSIYSVVKTGTTSGSQYAGGFVGYYESGTALHGIHIQSITLSAQSTTNDTYLGGLIAYLADGIGEMSENNKNHLEDIVVENICISDGSDATMAKSAFGGIIGRNDKADVNIDNVTSTFISILESGIINDINAKKTWYCGKVGGIIGFTSVDCNISNVHDLFVSTHTGGEYDSLKDSKQKIRTNVLGGVVAVAGTEDSNGAVTVNVSNVKYDTEIGLTATINPFNSINSDTSVSNVTIGGIVGQLQGKSVLCLDGMIDMSGINHYGMTTLAGYQYFGYVVGTQGTGLVYMNPISCTTAGYQYGLTLPDKDKRYGDEIGNYGAVYRNGNMDNTSYSEISTENIVNDKAHWLIQENALGETKVTGQIRENSSNEYVLETAGDVMRLSIALKSDTDFWTGCFNTTVTAAELLGGVYTLGSNDINLTGTGIVTINMNSNQISDAFSGTLKGNGHAITYEIENYYQPNVGLFSIVNGAVVENLTINGSVKTLAPLTDTVRAVNASYRNAGGLSALAYNDNGALSVQNVTVNVAVSDGDDSAGSGNRYYGGLFGWYKVAAGKALNIGGDTTPVVINAAMTNNNAKNFVGGIIGFVDTSYSYTYTAGTDINMKYVTLKGSIILGGAPSGTYSTGGVIAVLGNQNNATKNIQFNGDFITFDDFHITSEKTGNSWTDFGGLMGFRWKKMEANITNLTVTNSGINMQNTNAGYGGLWYSCYGHLMLENIEITGNSVFDVNSGRKNNSLLVRDGQFLYLELDGYTIDSTTIVAVPSGVAFDEIVGLNKGSNNGIVSISTKGEYELYKNQICPQNNLNTRYYYNLSKDLENISPLQNNETIDTVGKLLQWHLAHYVTEQLRTYFGVSGYTVEGENVTFGTIDLGDASYYPTENISGTYQSGTIIFHGEQFDQTVTNTNQFSQLLYSVHPESEHYKIQSGLFGDVTTANISDFTMSGSVTSYYGNNGMNSGALITGNVNPAARLEDENGYKVFEKTPTNISNITLSGLKVSNVLGDNYNSNYGLLVCGINEGAVVKFDDIQMSGYTGDTHVAAALIGRVGSRTSEAMDVTFVNMKIADVADGVNTDGTLSSTKSKVLAYASFIYSYEYYEDTSSGLYTFYKSDYDNGNVTLGLEIGTTVQFYDEDISTPIAAMVDGFKAEHYKPYVYSTVKKIDVNPKAGDITEGHGTYDDPYVITNGNQFITIYKYITDRVRYQSSLINWTINKYGDDIEFDNLGVRQKDTKTYDIETVTYDNLIADGFPSVKQLNEAYYMIKGDIDLTGFDDFTGFGSFSAPFVGVFVGGTPTEAQIVDSQVKNANQYTITMPEIANSLTAFGFIQYAKGAVVQNLAIDLGAKITISDGGYGAGVMAVIMGGDNIISGVTVTGGLKSGGTSTEIGGYVGELRLGALILRDMVESSLSGYVLPANAGNFHGIIAGAVEDGFAVFDDVISEETYRTADKKSLSPLKAIVNKSVFGTDSIHKIKVTNEASSNQRYELDSAVDVLTLSLALNSGALNYYSPMSYTVNQNPVSIFGYDNYSRCRNTDYSYVGNVLGNETSKVVYTEAIHFDNVKNLKLMGNKYGETYYHPYIYQFYEFAEGMQIMYLSNSNSVQSLLNVWGSINTYSLAAGTYDLSVSEIKDCFAGIGAEKYNIWGSYCMQGSFVGAGAEATILKMDVAVPNMNNSNTYAGLFNRLYGTASTPYEISDFKITGSVRNLVGNSVAGGIAAYVNTAYKFKNIIAEELTVEATSNSASAFVGYDEGSLEFENCQIKNSVITAATGRVGGFIAVIPGQDNVPNITFNNCSIDTLTANSGSSATGGFLGEGYCTLNVNTGTGNSNSTAIRGLIIENKGASCAGGIVGRLYSGLLTVNNVTLTNSNITNLESSSGAAITGGIAGYLSTGITADNITIGSTQVNETVTIGYVGTSTNPFNANGYAGGIVGQHAGGAVTITNSHITGAENSGEYTTKLINSAWVGGYIGGVTAASSVTITDPKVTCVFMNPTTSGANTAAGTSGAGGVMGCVKSTSSAEVTNALIQDVKIVTKDKYDINNAITTASGGIVGYSTCKLTITGFLIDKLNVGSDGYCGEAGGVAGIVSNAATTLNKNGEADNVIRNSMIAAGVAGGIYGNVQSNGTIIVNDTEITNVTVIARYGTTTIGKGWDVFAGGIGGREDSSGNAKYINVSLSNSVITGYQYGIGLDKLFIGGIVGGRVSSAKGGRSYNISMTNVLVGGLENVTESATRFPTYQSVIDGTDKLYLNYSDGTNGQMQMGLMVDTVRPEYTQRIGMFAGKVTSSNNYYVIKANVSYTGATNEGISLECFRPSVDVGTTSKFTSMTEAYAYYRDRYHIIYSDYDFDKADSSFDSYLNPIWDNNIYENSSTKTNGMYRLDVSYGQTNNGNSVTNEDMNNIYTTTFKDSEGYISTLKNENNEIIPMVVVSSWDYDVTSVINNYINIFTNNGGATNTVSGITSVTIDRKQLVDGIIQQETTTNQIISYTEKTGVFSVEANKYDSYTDDKNATYSVINVTYKYDAGLKYTISVPIYIKEMLDVQTHMEYMQGAHYSIDDVPSAAAGAACMNTSASIEHKSKFTLYSEFIYNDVRENYSNATLNKTIYMTDTNGNRTPFYNGTKLTLIDVTDGNKVYLYQVSDGTTSEIDFSDFSYVEDQTTKYINNNVGKDNLTQFPRIASYEDICNVMHTDIGLEQFMIIVDESGVNEELNVTHNIYVEALQEKNASIYRNMTYDRGCHVSLSEIPGLISVISGSTKYNSYTNIQNMAGNKDTILIDGSRIANGENVKFEGSIYVVSPSTVNTSNPNYWLTNNTSNNDSYVELAISILDSSGKRISIPNGTQIKFDDGKSYYANDSSYIYYYLNRLQTDDGDEGYLNLADLRADTIKNFSVSMDFTNADLTEITTGTYQIYIELLNTDDYEYPRSGEQIDDKSLSVSGISKKQLGFAIMAEEMIKLGINGYNSDKTDDGLINFTSSLDFTDFVDGSGNAVSEINNYVGKYLTYTFVIEQKKADGYVSYPIGEKFINIYDGRLDNLPDSNNSLVVSKTKQYSVEEIQNAKSHIMEEDFTIYVDADSLLADSSNATNYKVTCYLTVTDTDPSAEETKLTTEQLIENHELTDFFVLTVAKLKTDLD